MFLFNKYGRRYGSWCSCKIYSHIIYFVNLSALFGIAQLALGNADKEKGVDIKNFVPSTKNTKQGDYMT